jgi:dissimilatory sulfite reductase beta subunit
MSEPRQPIESGVPDPFPMMHPVMKKNYGNWKYHENPRPGVIVHYAHGGDAIWTVRAGTQRQLDVYSIHTLCDIADEQGDGFVRFTTRSNIEYMVEDQAKVEPLIKALTDAGFPVGGTGSSVSQVAHTQGWLHCDIPGTDASGVVKAVMDELYEEFTQENMPNKVKLGTQCCQINCGGHNDIDLNVQHTRPPVINHDLVSKVCERPTVVARCPVAAIRPVMVNGKPSLEVDEKKCMCCGACFPPCPPMQINHPVHTKIAIWVGGKNSSARSKPDFHKLAVSNLPNNPPRWPECADALKKILFAYKNGARPYERVGEWIDRIGWGRFFEETGLPFTKLHIADWRNARASLNHSAQIRF